MIYDGKWKSVFVKQNIMKTIRLLYPDYVSGGLDTYYFAANLLQYILPQNPNQPVVKVDIVPPDGNCMVSLASFDYLHGKYERAGIIWIDAHPVSCLLSNYNDGRRKNPFVWQSIY